MLSADQINKFRTDGYLVVPDVVPQSVLDKVRAEYAQLLDYLYSNWDLPQVEGFEQKLITAYSAGKDWFQPMDISLPGDRIHADTPMHIGPAVFEMATHPRILDLVEDLIGPEITSNPIQHVRIKPPVPQIRDNEVRAHLAATDWHQDRAVALAEADQTDMITVWLAVTDATIENGCLKVQPFSGAQEILPHCPKKQTAIADEFINEDGAIPLPVPSGGVVLFHPLVPHASLDNNSDNIRWSFDLRYNRTGQPSGRSHFPEFVARSSAAPKTELHDWQLWKAMWEDARAHLASQPHVDIHRWKSDAPFCA